MPRLPLATLPTPLHRLERVSTETGADVWIKRDDLTGFGMGGNKVRKAEFLLADALERSADVVLTAGAVQSNHARVIAAAARRCGLECHLFLSGQPPAQPAGNLLLDHLAEARIHIVGSSAERAAAMGAYAEQLRGDGRRPYVIPIGGSNAVGATGYAAGFEELEAQLRALTSEIEKPTRLVFASSSGGTYAGLLAGRAAVRSNVLLLGIRVDRDPNPEAEIAQIASSVAQAIGVSAGFHTDDVSLDPDYVGEGYGIPTPEGLDALRLLWRAEGILLDPVYTGKAMAGLLALARDGAFENERVIFLHTGGAPAVFADPRVL